MTLFDRLNELSIEHGSLRNASTALGIDVSYLSRLASGEKEAPSQWILDKLGLVKVVTYRRKKTEGNP